MYLSGIIDGYDFKRERILRRKREDKEKKEMEKTIRGVVTKK